MKRKRSIVFMWVDGVVSFGWNNKKCRQECRHSRPGGPRHSNKIRFFGAFAMAALLHAADPLYDSARKKLDMIEEGRAPRGSVVTFPVAEINAWARVKVPE